MAHYVATPTSLYAARHGHALRVLYATREPAPGNLIVEFDRDGFIGIADPKEITDAPPERPAVNWSRKRRNRHG